MRFSRRGPITTKKGFEMLEDIELIQAKRKRNSQRAKIEFGETVEALITSQSGTKTKFGPRSEAKQKWQNRAR